jgi:S-adenosylmethionine:tRNA ribosyltransferase-isomerase
MDNKYLEIQIKDYDYSLPAERIAYFPLEQRDQSKLLQYRDGGISDHGFSELPAQLPQGSLMVFNDTRVIEARIFFQKSTGGIIEIFCLEPHEQSVEEAMQQTHSIVFKCLIGGASKWKPGQVLQKSIGTHESQLTLEARYVAREEDDFLIRFSWTPFDMKFVEVLHAAGAIPLPPYIKRSAEQQDQERYQTVFSKHEGSVAAPTASLHFTTHILEALKARNVDTAFLTLHVGAGTFKPVKAEQLAEHHMHGEPFSVATGLIQKLLTADTIIAVGTTSLRSLESLYWIGVKLLHDVNADLHLEQWEAYELQEKYGHPPVSDVLQHLLSFAQDHQLQSLHCRTSLLIAPGYQFHLPAALVTNFHQPQSTLILLVAAFVGEDWKTIYQHALDNGYRFLSYGDSSLLWRKK